MPFDPTVIRQQFPFLQIDPPPVYLDSAAMAQMPDAVIDAMNVLDRTSRANVHRGVHLATEKATLAYEDARTNMQKFVNAGADDEIVFTKNCTEAINLVAASWGRTHLRMGDRVVLSVLEHHSNILPWMQLREERGIDIGWIEVDAQGALDFASLDRLLSDGRTKLVAVTGQSNVIGVRPECDLIIANAHRAGALVLMDAAQLIAHHPVDVRELEADFLAFSGHKLYGPTGIGVLYAKRALLKTMPIFLGGGGTIREVDREHFVAADPPARFEGGTPPITQAVGLAAAIRWLQHYSWQEIEQYEARMIAKTYEVLRAIPQLSILGPQHPAEASGCVSFVLDGVHPHDLTDILGQQGIALRAGHHCAQPLHKHFGIPASTRVSIGIYTTEEELDLLASGIIAALKILN